MSVESKLNTLSDSMKDLPVSMRIFSLCMRSLYAEQSLGSSSDTAMKINKIRDDTRDDAMVYINVVLPASTELVRTLKQYFEFYEELSIGEWLDNLSDIVDEVRGYRQCCVEIIRLHEQIMIPLKMREDEAKVLIAELEILSEELKRKKAELEESASTKRGWAIGLAFIPGINLIASPLLNIRADSDLANAVAEGVQCEINNAAVVVMSDTMIPALAAFIDGLDDAAGFFSVVEQELATFQYKGEKALETPKKLHYIMMKKKATEIKQSCTEFFAMIPGVRTDLLCIPTSGTDQNYVDKWLKKQQEDIEKRYEKTITGHLRKMLMNLSSGGGEKLMVEGKK